ncbi:hexokinase [Breznakiella homolactica]|uniref:Hexokinase n=1 Tax=Breznakiella homolactica TaxID=2798577 RepID=A0A7T8BAN5_9SPIR|nr:hexokinase [Breznakiella homolactica]QQO10909.1 hexokinase [Breznakiella homolactica]
MTSSFNPEELAEFARYYGFHYDVCDPAVLVRDIKIDMERGLRGQPSSLAMLPSYLRPISQVPPGKSVIALDAGGTNLRSALVRFDENGNIVAEGTRKAPMPGTRGPVSAEQFFDEIADLVIPFLEDTRDIEGIGFCFSYPMEMTQDSDGILIGFSKEVDAPDVIGKAIGSGLREAIARRGKQAPERIVLLNDTVSTLLCGLAELPSNGGRWQGEDKYGIPGGPVIGFILGTGINIAYPEKQIPKIGFDSASAPQVVVCETGNFTSRYQGILDRSYDATTKNPSGYTFEKATAGAYLGPLSLFILKQAVRDGVIRFGKSEELLAMETLQTKDLNAFMHAPLAAEGPVGSLFSLDERDALASLVYTVSLITERAGMFAAAALTAAVKQIGEGYDPFVPVRIAVEGTTYVVYKGMRESLESHLHTMMYAEKPRNYMISPVEQASLFGAAVAALSN